MPVEMKVWTCKFPADSDLTERLREASKQINQPYYKLLTNMLDLWENRQIDTDLPSDALNARINKLEKFMQLAAEHLKCEWDAAAETWTIPGSQHSEAEEQPAAEPAQSDIIEKEQQIEEEPESGEQPAAEQTTAEVQPEIEPEQDGARTGEQPAYDRQPTDEQPATEQPTPEEEQPVIKSKRKKQTRQTKK